MPRVRFKRGNAPPSGNALDSYEIGIALNNGDLYVRNGSQYTAGLYSNASFSAGGFNEAWRPQEVMPILRTAYNSAVDSYALKLGVQNNFSQRQALQGGMWHRLHRSLITSNGTTNISAVSHVFIASTSNLVTNVTLNLSAPSSSWGNARFIRSLILVRRFSSSTNVSFSGPNLVQAGDMSMHPEAGKFAAFMAFVNGYFSESMIVKLGLEV